MVRILKDYKVMNVETEDQIHTLKSLVFCGYELVGGAYLGREGQPRQAIALYDDMVPEESKPKGFLRKLLD